WKPEGTLPSLFLDIHITQFLELWVADIQGNLSLIGLFEFFQLWDSLQEVIALCFFFFL
ncbi:hypothetical protein ACJX0J_010759, partial [Zea mays]